MSIFALLFLGGIGVVFLAIGVWLIRTFIQQIKVVLESRDWLPAPGKIIASKVSRKLERSNSNDNGPSEYFVYRPEIRYEYMIGEIRYVSDQITIGDVVTSRDDDKIQEVVNKYPVNTEIRAYYKPSDPKTVVLEPGNIGETWRRLAGGLVCIGVAYILIRMGILIFQSS